MRGNQLSVCSVRASPWPGGAGFWVQQQAGSAVGARLLLEHIVLSPPSTCKCAGVVSASRPPAPGVRTGPPTDKPCRSQRPSIRLPRGTCPLVSHAAQSHLPAAFRSAWALFSVWTPSFGPRVSSAPASQSRRPPARPRRLRSSPGSGGSRERWQQAVRERGRPFTNWKTACPVVRFQADI